MCKTVAHSQLLHVLSRCGKWGGRGGAGKSGGVESVRGGCSNGTATPPSPLLTPCPLPPFPPLPLSRWERFTSAVDKQRSCEAVQLLFPFKEYFADAPQPIFKGTSYEAVSEGVVWRWGR